MLLLAAVIWWQKETVIGVPVRWQIQRSVDQHDPRTAFRWASRGRQLLPNDPEMALARAGIARRLGRMELVEQDLADALKLGADAEDVQREQWLALAQTGQMQRAEPHLAQLLRNAPRNADVCEAYVLGFIRTNRTDTALTLLEAWIADDPNNAKPRLMKGQVLRLLSNFSEAESEFQAAMTLAPHWLDPQLELAELLVERNRFDEALPLLEALTTADPATGASVRRDLALAECHLTNGQTEAAVQLLQDAHRRAPEALEPAVVLGRALIESGRYDEALEPLQAALKIRPGYDETHYLLSQAYAFSGDREQAQKHSRFVQQARAALEELDRLNAQLLQGAADAETLIRAGEIQLKYGDPTEGAIRILSGLDLAPDNQKGLELLADHYAELAASSRQYQELAQDFAERLQAARSTSPSP